MPLELALLPFVESGFDPYAYSHGGAVGLWQFMPATGKRFGLQQDWWFEGRRDIVQSTQAAVEYLTYLNDMFDGDWMLAIAAYNSGEGRVQRAVRANKKAGKPADFFSLKLPAETRAYVPRLLAISDIVRNAERYGLELPSLTNAPRVIPTNVGGQIELAVISELSGVPSARIAELNPGFNRWATSPTGEHAVLIPLENQQQLTEGLAQLPTKQRVSWQRYQVKSGDSLGKIAQQHHTTVKVLMTSNDLNNHLIRKGQHLMIPLGDNARLPPVRAGEAKPIKYQVKSGDSLWLIAKKHGVKYQDISRWNALSSTTLRPGQSLDIYTKTPQKEVRTVKYRVRSGDSLSVIAKRFDVTINALKQWNGLNSDRLRAGQNLTIKVDINRG
nr:LysM peptidoglycan-binding domain-containing protein [Echinimonas agarilytica]